MNGAIKLDKEIAKFIDMETNAFQGTFIVSREKTPNGYERIIYKIIGGVYDGMLFDAHWRKIGEPPTLEEKKPKSTGGKKPYLMLMVDEIKELKKSGVKNVEELIGYVVCLGEFIEWNTGRLIHKRSKKPIQYKDLLEIYSCSKPKLNKMINLMKEHDLLYYTDEGYFISQKYIKKGKSK